MSCRTGKIGYPTEALAEQALYLAIRKGVVDPSRVVPTRAYYCEECNRYHLTSRPLFRPRIKTHESNQV